MRLPLSLVLGAIAVGASCALGGFERGPEPVIWGPLGGQGGSGGVGGAPSCEHFTFPDPPSEATAPGDESFVVALHEIFFEVSGTPVGVDLDRRCTCYGDEGGSCVPGGGHALLPADYACDFDGGRDNAFSRLATSLENFLNTDLVATYSAAANSGEWTALVRVSGYNGESDDGEVRVDWLQAGGFGDGQPSWDGSDVWPVSEAAYDVDANGMVDPTRPKHFDDNAYVRDGILVANLPTSPIIFASQALGASQAYFELQLSSGGLMARIAGAAGARELRDGVVAGIINEEAIFTAIATFRDDDGKALCPGQPTYDIGRALFCGARDSHDQVVGPTTECNGLSFGIGFSADPVVVAGTTPPTLPAPSTCAMGGAGPETACPDPMGTGGAGGSP